MGAGREGEFSVTVSRKEVVAAVLPLLGHRLPLSNLDLLLPPLDVGVFFCYNKPIISFFGPLGANNINTNNDTISFGSVARVLKRAMAQVLVYYYPFAGEVVANSVGEPELLCNNRGVDVFEAFADIELKDLNLYNPDQSIEGKLVPQKKAGVLAVQITELKCGGLVVACAFDHRIADAYSANMFLVSWAEMAESKSISVVPCFRRSLLSPRRPAGHIDPLVDNLYVPISCMPPPPRPTTPEDPHHHQANAADDNSLISRIYYIKSDDLNRLQSLASFNEECKRSKLESLSAFLWQMVAKYADISSEDDASKTATSKLGIVVDGRNRLSSDDDENAAVDRATLMAAYFGNVLSIPYGTKRVDQLIENPLSWVAEEVHGFLENAVTKDHFLSLIDWVEARRPEPAVTKIYCSEINDGPALVVSSGRSFPVSKVNFGWGAPLFGSYHFPWGGNTGYVMPMPSPAGNGDWIVYMHLFRGQLDFFETEAVDLFRPLTYDYLSLN